MDANEHSRRERQDAWANWAERRIAKLEAALRSLPKPAPATHGSDVLKRGVLLRVQAIVEEALKP